MPDPPNKDLLFTVVNRFFLLESLYSIMFHLSPLNGTHGQGAFLIRLSTRILAF